MVLGGGGDGELDVIVGVRVESAGNSRFFEGMACLQDRAIHMQNRTETQNVTERHTKGIVQILL